MANVIELKGLSKQYPGVRALDNVTLDIEEGKLFALLGPNGAGKTTLLRILTTQIDATSGSAKVLGRDISTQGDEVRKLVSYVPQEMSVWTDITAYENLLIYSKIYGIDAKKREAAIRSSLDIMELSDASNRLVSTFSGGMVRKLEIASAVMVEPKAIFLDEPTIGLDPVARRTVWDKLKSLNRTLGLSVLFSTHYMDEADMYADEIGVISHGHLAKVGAPEELKRSVGYEQVHIEFTGVMSQKLIDELGQIQGVSSVGRSGEGHLDIQTTNSDETLNPIMKKLIEHKVGVRSVSASKPSMDDVFKYYSKDLGAADETGRMAGMTELRRTRDRIRKG